MNNESQICFISSPHDSFFCGKVVEFKERYHKSPDEYHKALFYCLGINCDTRRNFENIYELSALIRVAVVSAFNADVKFPELNTEKEEQSNLNDWESSKAYMMKLQERRKNK